MTATIAEISAQLDAGFGLRGLELRCNLSQAHLFEEAIENDRGRVTIDGPADAQKAFPTALGKDGPLVYFSDPECTGRPVQDTFCVDRPDTSGRVWGRYGDGWRNSGELGAAPTALAVVGPDRYLAATTEAVVSSEDAGRTWTTLAPVTP